MGILDDAIKQHLELKRRRGGDPTEIERLEREALGPVRRLQHEPSDEHHPVAGQAETSYDEPEGHEALEDGEEFEDEYESEGDYESDRMASGEDASPVGSGSIRTDEPEGRGDDELGSPLPARDWDEPQPGASDEDLGVETAEYDVEAEHAREGPGHPEEGAEHTREGEDVLEETPEFFQDAPDHDRLWFEQRPPKDFDFDG
jgi:hypothetical protein